MQYFDSVDFGIEQLLFELARCVNDLQGFRRQLSIDDAKQAEFSLIKLQALISSVSFQKSPPRLALV